MLNKIMYNVAILYAVICKPFLLFAALGVILYVACDHKKTLTPDDPDWAKRPSHITPDDPEYGLTDEEFKQLQDYLKNRNP